MRRHLFQSTQLASAARFAATLKAHPNSPDAKGLAEYSVVYTDRAVNHMSGSFQSTFLNINKWLKDAYNAEKTLLLPGSGSTGMEAVARQFAVNENVLVVRNGLFSFRWSQIFDAGKFAKKVTVCKARRAAGSEKDPQAPFAPAPIEEVVAAIKAEKPAVVFAPHVETSAGILLPNEYIQQMSAAVHEYGGMFVLDGIASGCVWVDMKALGADVYITAPQKGWSAPASTGIVMLGERAIEKLKTTQSNSFLLDLNKWNAVTDAYLGGAHMYHATLPTDSLQVFETRIREAREEIGLEKLEKQQWELGRRTLETLANNGLNVVAADGFRSPSVVVAYTKNPAAQTGAAFKQRGMQVAGGVPLFVDEGSDFKTFRFGMLGFDKLGDVEGTIAQLDSVLKDIGEL